MVDPAKIESLFSNLNSYLDALSQLALLSEQELAGDRISLGAAKYYLQVSVECCIDVAHHLIAREGFRAPATYADSFTVLEENGVIDAEFCATAHRMVRMRNRLVHLYWEVDADILHDTLQHNLTDFDRFREFIYRYMQRAQ
jgi:uncharacterized protein YutE (UPF0331/DUF86 family)